MEKKVKKPELNQSASLIVLCQKVDDPEMITVQALIAPAGNNMGNLLELRRKQGIRVKSLFFQPMFARA